MVFVGCNESKPEGVQTIENVGKRKKKRKRNLLLSRLGRMKRHLSSVSEGWQTSDQEASRRFTSTLTILEGKERRQKICLWKEDR